MYQVGSNGVLPTGTAPQLAQVPITILPGFNTAPASLPTNPATSVFPFGLWFAGATPLYVCDEGDPQVLTSLAGLQKWRLANGMWTMLYVLRDGLNIGQPYSVANYPTSLNPATSGCRNIIGHHNTDGTVSVYAVTSTISANGDNGPT